MNSPAPVHVLMVCTGNAARSVMARVMLEHRAAELGWALVVDGAGTHAIDGQPVSWRTRDAVSSVREMAGSERISGHRSRQLDTDQLAQADVVVAMEADHVRYVRRVHPEAAARTATLRRLARDLPPGPPGSLRERVAALGLAGIEPEPWEEVDDPAGGDLPTYVGCAQEVWGLTGELLPRL